LPLIGLLTAWLPDIERRGGRGGGDGRDRRVREPLASGDEVALEGGSAATQ
jgi:hypothetical protein